LKIQQSTVQFTNKNISNVKLDFEIGRDL
jgi:hypothetical protein